MNKLVYKICLMVAILWGNNAHALNTHKSQPDTTFLYTTTDSTGSEYEVLQVKTMRKYVRPEILPDSATQSLDLMARYIMVHYDTDKDRLWAIYSWICKNVKYSLSALETQNKYQGQALADYTFKKKIGVCANYAELFHQLAKKIGIESYVLSGYTISYKASNNPRHA